MNATQTIAGYDILDTVHVGRQTTILRARSRMLAREVAIKCLSAQLEPGGRERALRGLRREAELLATLEHPGFVPLYECGEWARGPFLVMRWLPGGTLLGRSRSGVALSELVELVARVAGSLDALHALGFVHGDLSVRNIAFDCAGLPQLIDLASAVEIGTRWTDPASRWPSTALTAAPELARGEPVDGRADLYSLAAIAYFLLTGSWPHEADDDASLRARHVEQSVLPPSSRCDLLTADVDAVLLRALDQRPDRRFASGAELAQALARVVQPLAGPSSRVGMFTAPPRAVGPSDAVVVRAWQQLEAFAEGLPPEQRAAFAALVAAIEREDADAMARCGALVREAVAPVAAMVAAEQLGLFHALAAGPMTSEALAHACAARPEAIARLCRYLGQRDQLVEHEGAWRLQPPLAGAYAHGRRLGVRVEIVGDTLATWSRLAQWATSGEGAFAMDADVSGAAYVDGTAQLGDSCEGAAAQLVELLAASGCAPAADEACEILDVGAGSAVWSLAMLSAWPRAHATALDRPRVLDVALARAAAAGLGPRISTEVGAWLETSLPARRHDLVVLGNVCHLMTPAELARVVAWLEPTLREGGRIVIVDVIPERLASGGESALRYDLALALRTARGQVHDLDGYQRALAGGGFDIQARGRVSRRTGSFDVLVAARKLG